MSMDNQSAYASNMYFDLTDGHARIRLAADGIA